MAPRPERMPQLNPLPSNAGPAEAAAAIKKSSLPRVISPLVPISIRIESSLLLCMPLKRTPEVVSPPT